MSTPLFRFRILVYWDKEYNTVVAKCLETGSVASADNATQAVELIRQILAVETRNAMDRKDIRSLFHCPAELYLWLDYRDWADEGIAPKSEWLTGNIELQILDIAARSTEQLATC